MDAALLYAGKEGRQRLVRKLRGAGAISAWSAQPFEPGNRMERRALDRALRCGMIRRTDEGTYWVDEEKVARIRAREVRWVIISILLMMLLFGILYILGEFP